MSEQVFQATKEVDQMQADRSIAGIPVGIDCTSLEREDFCFWKNSPAYAAALPGSGSRVVFTARSESPIAWTVHQFIYRQTSSVPEAFPPCHHPPKANNNNVPPYTL